jgi:acyl dehydratase
MRARDKETGCIDSNHQNYISATEEGRMIKVPVHGTSASDAWTQTRFGQPRVGMSAELSRHTSTRDVEMFTAMTRDDNPRLYDTAATACTKSRGLIVQEGITSGLLNAVVAEALPGPGSVFVGVEWRFLRAVRVGEEITARVEISAVRDDKPMCTLDTTVRDSQGKICLSGIAVTYTMPLPRAQPSERNK